MKKSINDKRRKWSQEDIKQLTELRKRYTTKEIADMYNMERSSMASIFRYYKIECDIEERMFNIAREKEDQDKDIDLSLPIKKIEIKQKEKCIEKKTEHIPREQTISAISAGHPLSWDAITIRQTPFKANMVNLKGQ